MTIVQESDLQLETADGPMTTFVFRGEETPGGTVIFYMDAAGIRPELKEMASRFCQAGYTVVLPDLYHRLGALISFAVGPTPPDPDRMANIVRHIRSVTNARAMEDTRAVLEWVDAEPDLKSKGVGVVGYCMGGPFTFMAASQFAGRVKAAASIYGVGCISAEPDSPHLQADKVTGELYFAYAEHDDHAPLIEIEPLENVLTGAGITHQIEVYRGAHHGFAFPQRAVYNHNASERHWKRVLALFERTLP